MKSTTVVTLFFSLTHSLLGAAPGAVQAAAFMTAHPRVVVMGQQQHPRGSLAGLGSLDHASETLLSVGSSILAAADTVKASTFDDLYEKVAANKEFTPYIVAIGGGFFAIGGGLLICFVAIPDTRKEDLKTKLAEEERMEKRMEKRMLRTEISRLEEMEWTASRKIRRRIQDKISRIKAEQQWKNTAEKIQDTLHDVPAIIGFSHAHNNIIQELKANPPDWEGNKELIDELTFELDKVATVPLSSAKLETIRNLTQQLEMLLPEPAVVAPSLLSRVLRRWFNSKED